MGRPPLRLGRPKGRPQAPFQPSHENRYPFTNWSTFAPPKWSKFTPPLTFIRLTGLAPGQQPFEILEDLVGYVATELNANPRDLDLYARRQPTLSAHLERVREHLGLTAFDEKARQRLAPFVFKEG